MTATLTPGPTSRPALANDVRTPHGSVFAAAIRSEWTKLRTVRSTIWSLLATFGITVGLGTLLSVAIMSRWDHLDPVERLAFDPVARSLSGVFLAQLAIGVLGVLLIGSEYTTGSIRTTFAAIPNRRLAILAKATVLGGVSLVVAIASTGTAFGLSQLIFQQHHVGMSLGDPNVLRAVLGGALYLTVVALMGFAIATIVRRTPGAIAGLFAIILVLPLLVRALPSPWDNNVSKLLPASAGESLFSIRSAPDILTPGHAIVVLGVWLAVLSIVALVAVGRRDA